MGDHKMAFWNSTDEKNTFRTNYSTLTNNIGKMQIFLQKVNNSLPTMTEEECKEVSTYLGIKEFWILWYTYLSMKSLTLLFFCSNYQLY